MNVLILEDKESTREALREIVLSCHGVDKVLCFGRRKDAYLAAMDNKIDLFLVDIILEPKKINDNSGIAFAESIRKYRGYRMTPIIFITVLMGLERELLNKIHCYNYIEKPIGDGRIVREQIEEVLDGIASVEHSEEKEHVPLHYDGIGYVIYLDDVIFFENKRGTLYIHQVDDEIVIPHLLAKNFSRMIKKTKFLEPIYGTYVNAKHIINVDFRNREVYMKDNRVVPIGGRKYKQFKEEYLDWKE